MTATREGLERAAIDAARKTRRLLAEAMAGLAEADERLAADLTFAVQALFRVEIDQGQDLRDRLREAGAVMSGVLSRLHAPELASVLDGAGASLARGLAMLYPARAGLERVLEERPLEVADTEIMPGPPAMAFERPLATFPKPSGIVPKRAEPRPPDERDTVREPLSARPSQRMRKNALALQPDHDAGIVDQHGQAGSIPPGDRRAEERAAFAIDIGLHSATQFFSGISGDLSEGGLFVATYTPKPVGTELHVSFVLPPVGGIGASISAPAIVAWVRNAEGSGAEPGMGLRFFALKDEDRRAIERFMKLRPPMLYEP